GLTISVILARYGYEVTIFDIHDKIGGVLRYGIPDFRLPKSVLDDFEYRHLRLKGIKVRPNTTIGTSITIDDLFRDGYKAVFVGTGTWRPKTLGIKGESLGNVHFGIDYLAAPEVYHLGDNVIVIGVGNAAMDVARTAIRKGSRNVTCFARRDKVSASQYEYSYAQLEGVRFEFNKAPIEIKDDGVIFADTRQNEEGKTVIIEGSESFYPSDSVIVSVSQGAMNRIVSTTKGLQVNSKGLLVADENGQTTRPGVFTSGDGVSGAKTVVEAVAASKLTAEAMHEYLQSLPKDQ
nr:FAD-dependent oxidoreductase [Erysipelotrichaceae bacterium]